MTVVGVAAPALADGSAEARMIQRLFYCSSRSARHRVGALTLASCSNEFFSSSSRRH